MERLGVFLESRTGFILFRSTADRLFSIGRLMNLPFAFVARERRWHGLLSPKEVLGTESREKVGEIGSQEDEGLVLPGLA